MNRINNNRLIKAISVVSIVLIAFWIITILFLNSTPMESQEMLPPINDWGFPFICLQTSGHEPDFKWNYGYLSANLLAFMLPLAIGIWLSKFAFLKNKSS